MMYRPATSFPIPPMVSVFTNGLGWVTEVHATGVPSSGIWEAASRAVYVPLVLPTGCVIRRVWWGNGTTTNGETVEVGVYADSGYGPGVKLVSGSAAQGTASQIQFVDVTGTVLMPGLYWLAVVAAVATSTSLLRTTHVGYYDASFRFQEASAYPLPATATPVESNSANLYFCGFATTASP